MPQASLPGTPRTWSAGDLVTVPRLRADPVNAIAFLLGRPTFAGTQTSGPAYSAGADTAVGLQAELIDNWSGHVTVTTNGALSSQYWAPVPGWYLCRAAIPFSYSSATQAPFAAGLQWTTGGVASGVQRGPLTLCGSTSPPIARVTDLVQLSNAGPPGGSGDWVQFMLRQDSSGSVSLVYNSTNSPYASARWVCATSGTASLPVPPLTAVPSPITSAWLNANVRDTIAQLIYPPICRAFYTSTGSTLASGTFPAGVSAPLNTVTVDNYSAFNTTSHTWTCPVSGRYIVAGQMNLNSSTGTTGYSCGVSVNGGTVQWGDSVNKVSDTSGGGAGFYRRMRFTAGDTVQLMACQGSGSSIAWNGSGINPTRLITVWEGI